MPPESSPQDENLTTPDSPPKKPRKKSHRPTRDEIENRVNQIRKMLRMNMSDGDIKRALSKEWGIAKHNVLTFIRLARKRNASMLDPGEDQHLATSLAHWSRKQQEAEHTIQIERNSQEKARKSIDLAEAEIDNIGLSGIGLERLEVLELRKKNAIKIMDHARRAIFSMSMFSKECQDRIDRLLGNYAPMKIARTKADGSDIDAGKLSAEEVVREMSKLGMQPLRLTHEEPSLLPPLGSDVIEAEFVSRKGSGE